MRHKREAGGIEGNSAAEFKEGEEAETAEGDRARE
jgi:hypothetical protein